MKHTLKFTLIAAFFSTACENKGDKTGYVIPGNETAESPTGAGNGYTVAGGHTATGKVIDGLKSGIHTIRARPSIVLALI